MEVGRLETVNVKWDKGMFNYMDYLAEKRDLN